jgi:hypothetical protein
VAPKFILPNTTGGAASADPVVKENPAYFEEFALKPLGHTWHQYEEAVATIERRARLHEAPPFAVIDTHPEGGSPADPRTQLATLAAYYMVADPDNTALIFYGGFEPGTSWQRHWCAAAAYDIGRPAGRWKLFSSGTDPATTNLQYRVYARTYDKALVLYRPLSFNPKNWGKGKLNDASAVTHGLGASYRPLRADGTLGDPVNRITLRSGEGAILIRKDS